MQGISIAGKILDDSKAVDSRNKKPGDVTCDEFLFDRLEISHAVLCRNKSQLNSMKFGVSRHNCPYIRKERVGNEDAVFFLRAGKRHEHSLGCSCRAIVH